MEHLGQNYWKLVDFLAESISGIAVLIPNDSQRMTNRALPVCRRVFPDFSKLFAYILCL